MRYVITVCFFLCIVFRGQAQGDKPKPNTLTPKEIADGWILLFDGETTFGWRTQTDEIKAADGLLEIGGRKETRARDGFSFALPTYELKCKLAAVYRGAKEKVKGVIGFVDVRNNWIGLLDSGFAGAKPEWQEITVRAGGGNLEFVEKRYRISGGNLAFHWATDTDTALMMRNVKFRPLNMQPLFNGTDLTGWKEFPGKKSKFTVTDGAINVKDGPGDLQTVGKYKDFILQLECKSNGKHLNSGIFFRCRDNEYQNGYEAQIRNQFNEKPDQKYSIEEYDPKTNKLIGKKEQFFTAVDYGTGAIYRRQPARKQMSKDGEWFTMTVVAYGNHLATWVNGVQVTDWYDNRPKSDNARTGCKLDAGHISIQGHDPTTDLSFKNLRIAEFK